jgi:hypothetical protein
MFDSETTWMVLAAFTGAWIIVSVTLTAWLMRTFYRHGYASRQWWRNERIVMLRAYLLITVCGGMLLLLMAEIIVFFWWLLWLMVLIKFARDWRRVGREKKQQSEGEDSQAGLWGFA